MVRRLLSQANPSLRSVKPRIGELQAEFNLGNWNELRIILEQSYKTEQPPQTKVFTASSPAESPPGPQQPEETRGVGLGSLHVEGVRLQTFFASLRGPFGERLRDMKTMYEAQYQNHTVPEALERLLATTVDPYKLLKDLKE